jgi:hypothetical protein
MTSPKKHLSSSPFKTDPVPVVEVFEVSDKVCHDLYGLGTVVKTDSHAITVDFGAQTVRITPPYAKLQHL